MPKEALPYEEIGFAIITPHGDVWGPEIFDDAKQARDYLDRLWNGREKWLGMGFTLAPAISTTAVTGPRRVKLAPALTYPGRGE